MNSKYIIAIVVIIALIALYYKMKKGDSKTIAGLGDVLSGNVTPDGKIATTVRKSDGKVIQTLAGRLANIKANVKSRPQMEADRLANKAKALEAIKAKKNPIPTSIF